MSSKVVRFENLPVYAREAVVKFEYLKTQEVREIVRKTQESGLQFRKYRPARVTKYANAKKAGQWHPSAAPIVLTRDGICVDGVHRLRADLEAETECCYLVVREWPVDAYMGFDRNMVRSDQQLSHGPGRELKFTKDQIATLKAAIMGWMLAEASIATNVTLEVMDAAYAENSADFDAVFTLFSSHPAGINAGVRGAFVRARHLMSDDEFIAATEIVTAGQRSGASQFHDRTMVTLLKTLSHLRSGGAVPRQVSYDKAASALRGFSERRILTKLYGHAEEMLPHASLDKFNPGFSK